jgi:hypothetical protein
MTQEIEQKYVYCTIRIKQEQVPYNYSSDYKLRQKRTEELKKIYETDFFKVLNAVVDLGGSFCLDKYTLDSEYRMFQPTIKIKIPKDTIEKVKSLPQIENISAA